MISTILELLAFAGLWIGSLVVLFGGVYLLGLLVDAIEVHRARQRNRIFSGETFVDDPHPNRGLPEPLRVIGGSGAGSTSTYLTHEEES